MNGDVGLSLVGEHEVSPEKIGLVTFKEEVLNVFLGMSAGGAYWAGVDAPTMKSLPSREAVVV